MDDEEAQLWEQGAYEPTGWYAEVDVSDGFFGLIGDDSFYHEELSPMVEYMR